MESVLDWNLCIWRERGERERGESERERGKEGECREGERGRFTSSKWRLLPIKPYISGAIYLSSVLKWRWMVSLLWGSEVWGGEWWESWLTCRTSKWCRASCKEWWAVEEGRAHTVSRVPSFFTKKQNEHINSSFSHFLFLSLMPPSLYIKSPGISRARVWTSHNKSSVVVHITSISIFFITFPGCRLETREQETTTVLQENITL